MTLSYKTIIISLGKLYFEFQKQFHTWIKYINNLCYYKAFKNPSKDLPVTCKYRKTISKLFSSDPCSMYMDCSMALTTSSKIASVSAQVRIFSCRSCILVRNRNQDFGKGEGSNDFNVFINASWKLITPGMSQLV